MFLSFCGFLHDTWLYLYAVVTDLTKMLNLGYWILVWYFRTN